MSDKKISKEYQFKNDIEFLEKIKIKKPKLFLDQFLDNKDIIEMIFKNPYVKNKLIKGISEEISIINTSTNLKLESITKTIHSIVNNDIKSLENRLNKLTNLLDISFKSFEEKNKKLKDEIDEIKMKIKSIVRYKDKDKDKDKDNTL